MANKYVNFNAPSPYASQQADLERRQRLAELMQQQAMQPIETNNTSITPTQGLAKVLQSYLSAKQLDKINTEQRNIEQSQVQEITSIISKKKRIRQMLKKVQHDLAYNPPKKPTNQNIKKAKSVRGLNDHDA